MVAKATKAAEIITKDGKIIMSITKTTRLGLAILLITLSLTACAGGAPAAAATPTVTLAPTETAAPTETPYPTETLPAAPTAATTAGTPAAGTPAAGTPAATLAGSTPAAGTTPAAGAATKAVPAAGGTGAADKYSYLGQSLTDKMQLLPGRQMSITWTIKNAGTNGWTKDYMLRYFSGPKADKDIYTFGKDVAAGGTLNLIVTFTTPSTLGDYDMWFKLTNAQMQNFGDLDFAYTVTNSPNNSPTKAPAAPTATATK